MSCIHEELLVKFWSIPTAGERRDYGTLFTLLEYPYGLRVSIETMRGAGRFLFAKLQDIAINKRNVCGVPNSYNHHQSYEDV